MNCQWEHNWDWDNNWNKWVCLDCGETAESIHAFIAPCLACGTAVEADEVYCQRCLEEA